MAPGLPLPPTMPVIVLLDTSLSMTRPVAVQNSTPLSHLTLAQLGLSSFLDYQAHNNRLDLTSLLFFSRTCQVVAKFSRDYDSLKSCLQNVHTFDKTNLINALCEVRTFINEEWASNHSIHVVIVTDGNALLQSSFLHKNVATLCELDSADADSASWPLPLPFKSRIHIMCMTTAGDPSFQRSLSFYREIICRNSPNKPDVAINVSYEGGQIWVSDAPILSCKRIKELFMKLSLEHFKPLIGKVICGNLSCSVTIYPNLTSDQAKNELQHNFAEISICGFLNIDEIASPPVYSRHLILPMPETSIEEFKKWMSFVNLKADISDEELQSMFSDEGRQPSVGVLLHGSMKIANMVALCQIGPSSKWYGILYSGNDNKKKSCLMLSTFEPGLSSIPWIANFTQLGVLKSDDLSGLKAANTLKKPSNYVVWLQQVGIQSDVQKILRYARKLPDKYEALILEINRIKKTATAFNFDLVDILVKLLEREARLLPSTAHTEALNYINNIIKYLKQPEI